MEKEKIYEEKLLMNGVEVKLKNPGGKGIPHFLKLGRSMSKMPQVDKTGKTPEQIKKEKEIIDNKFMEYMDNDAIEAITALINLSLEKTFGTITDEVDEWSMKNAMLIMPKVMEMCSPEVTREDSRKEELEKKIKG